MAQLNIVVYGCDVKMMYGYLPEGSKGRIEKSCTDHDVNYKKILDKEVAELGAIIDGRKWTKQDFDAYFSEFQKEKATGWASDDEVNSFVSIKLKGAKKNIDKEKITVKTIEAVSEPVAQENKDYIVLTNSFDVGTTNFYITDIEEGTFDESKIVVYVKDFTKNGSNRKIIDHVEYDGKKIEYFDII